MHTYDIHTIAKILHATLEGNPGVSHSIRHLLTDSRNIGYAKDGMFVAIRGNFQDGHAYIPQAIQKGITCFLVEEIPAGIPVGDIVFLVVPDTIRAIQQLATFHRKQFQLPVIGITGSNGKTTVKEWLWQVLSVDLKVCRSPKSFNSQIGVPLSVWQLDAQDEVAIFEAGISLPGEMEKLTPIISPTIGIFTNLGSAHGANFENNEAKAFQKAHLFQEAETIIYRFDYIELKKAIATLPGKKTGWSDKDASADIRVRFSDQANGTRTEIFREGRTYTYQIPYNDEASKENAVHVFLAALEIGIDPDEISARMGFLHPVGLRMEMVAGPHNYILVNDAYSADLDSLKIALESLERVSAGKSKTLILSDLEQSGMNRDLLYPYIARLISEKGIRRFIGVGPNLGHYKNIFPPFSEFYQDTEALLKKLHHSQFKDEVILVKGARKFRFENIVKKLEDKVHQTVLEINLDALVNNLNYFRRKLPHETRWMAMVKASSYGTGSYEVANVLQYYKVDYLAVAYADEGIQLRENGIHVPVLVINPVLERIDKLIEYKLDTEIYNLRTLKKIIDYHQTFGISPALHIKIDTGMRRLGFEWNELDELIKLLSENPSLQVVSLFSHLAGSDEPEHDDFSREQILKFKKATAQIEKSLGKTLIKHILNTRGISRFPEAAMDMVRLGIGLYGLGADEEEQRNLEPVARLKSVISQIKNIHPGESIGYSRTFMASKTMKTATIPIGYADGFRRSLSNGKGKVWINGKEAFVVGNVCMDMIMVDVTDIPAEEGDEVEIFGEHIPIRDFAAMLDTIPYEVLTSLPTRVRRAYSWGNA